MARIDDAVRRILTKKFELGLFEHPYTDRTHLGQIGSPAHRAVARRPSAESQVLLKNRTARAAAPRRARRLRRRQQRRQHRQPGRRLDADLAGRLDQRDPRARRSSTASARTPSGRRHLQRGRVGARSRADAVGVVVVGETPYSEGFGDVGGPQWAYDPGDNNVPRPVKNMQLSAADTGRRRQGLRRRPRKCVVVVVSGRPLIIDPAQLRRTSTRWSRRGCPAARARASPTRCSAAGRSPASCR